jgi:RHS repeat-associated protein
MTYGYDTYGRPTTVTPTGLPTRTTNYDVLNRPTNLYDGVNASPTVLGYEDSLHLTRVTDPGGQVYRFTFNAVSWLTQRTDPVSRADGYEYDRDGAARRWTNRRGQTVDQTYDALHRSRAHTPSGAPGDSLTYSGDARVITGYSAISTETQYLDPRFRPDSVRTVMGGRTFWRRYHYTGRFLDTMSATIDNGAFTFLQRLYAVTTSRGTLDSMRLGSNWTRFRFTPDLSATVTHFPGTDSLVRGFTERHGPDSIRAGTALYDRYGYDGFARVQQVTDALSSPNKYRQFSYDSLGHLRQTIFGTTPTGCAWTMQNGWRCTGGGTDSTHTFAYDSVGNRRDHGGSYTTGNRITAFNGCTYGTDYDGNVTSRSYAAAPCPNQNLTFTWTADNRLASFAVAGGASVTLDYDAFGRLVRRSVNGSPRSYFLWDGDNLLAELDGTAAGKVAEYSWYGLDNLHAIVREAFAHHAETDALGNVRALTNLTGLVTRTNTYDEWGRLIAATDTALGDSARVRWKGALWLGPDAELYYMRNRWYEPWTGRFLSEDPADLDAGLNLYSFAEADPVGGVDPFGLDCNKPGPIPCMPGIEGTAPRYYWPVSGPRAMDGDQFNCYDGAVCVSGMSGSNAATGAASALPQQTPACNVERAQIVVNSALDLLSAAGYLIGAGLAARGLVSIAEGGLTRVLARGVGVMGLQTAGRAGALRAVAAGGTALARGGAAQVLRGASVVVATSTPRLTVPFEPSTFGAVALLAPGVGTYRAIRAYRECRGGR